MLPDLKPQRSEADGRVKVVFEYGPSALSRRQTTTCERRIRLPNSSLFRWDYLQRVVEGYGQIVEGVLRTAQVKSLVEK